MLWKFTPDEKDKKLTLHAFTVYYRCKLTANGKIGKRGSRELVERALYSEKLLNFEYSESFEGYNVTFFPGQNDKTVAKIVERLTQDLRHKGVQVEFSQLKDTTGFHWGSH